MPAHPFSLGVWVFVALVGLANAHIAAFHWAMYCVNGTDPTANPNNNDEPVQPLYELPYNEFWMHHSNGCDEYPPDEGVFLELDAGGNFTVELAGNRAETTLNLDPGARLTDWGDGMDHPGDYIGSPCIFSPNLHTHNETAAAGTAWAISYTSDIKSVTLENLVVFSVKYHTPYKRVVTYDVPAGMPPCPDEGCICTWLWIPDSCGILNMYMFPYRCKVNPDSSPKTIGKPQPPVWCEDDKSKCVAGPKQMIVWNQLEKNNVPVSGYDISGNRKVPVYNMKCGFQDGAQLDIYVNDSSTLDASNSTTFESSVPPTVSATRTLSDPPESGTPSASVTPPPSDPPQSGTPATPTPSESGTPAAFVTPSDPPKSGMPSASVTPPSDSPQSGTPATPTPSDPPESTTSPSDAGPSQPLVSATPSVLPSGYVTPGADPSDVPTHSPAFHTTDECSSPSPSPSSAGARRAHSQRMLREKRSFH